MKPHMMAGLLLALASLLSASAFAAQTRTHPHGPEHVRAERPADAAMKKPAHAISKQNPAAARKTKKTSQKPASKTPKRSNSKQRCQHSTFCWR